MLTRALFTIIFLLSIFFLPWWVFLIWAIAGILLFENYYELAAVGFIYDLSFGLPAQGFFGSQFAFCLISLAAVCLAEEIKKRTIFYDR